MEDPALKYADKVSPAHKMAMEAIGMLYQVLNQHRKQFEELIESERNMHTVGAILDPTLYRDMLYSRSFAQQMRLVRAAVAFLKEVDGVYAEVKT